MAKLTFLAQGDFPGASLDLNDPKIFKGSESILDLASHNGIPLMHACGGFCACTTCQIEVKSGFEFFKPMGEDETDRIDSVPVLTPKSRLGCQAKIDKAKLSAETEVQVEIVNLEL